MKTVTIYPPVEIFPDPEFCEQFRGNKKCDFLGSKYCIVYCLLFKKKLSIEKLYPVPLFGKCDQCKDLFKKSLSKEDNADRELGSN